MKPKTHTPTATPAPHEPDTDSDAGAADALSEEQLIELLSAPLPIGVMLPGGGEEIRYLKLDGRAIIRASARRAGSNARASCEARRREVGSHFLKGSRPDSRLA